MANASSWGTGYVKTKDTDLRTECFKPRNRGQRTFTSGSGRHINFEKKDYEQSRRLTWVVFKRE